MSVLSRRDFLRLRRTERGRVLELSCRTLFMRLIDASIEPAEAEEWEPSMGEPPAVFARRSPDDILAGLEQELGDAQVVRLLDAEWLESIPHAQRITTAIQSFRARGGLVETS